MAPERPPDRIRRLLERARSRLRDLEGELQEWDKDGLDVEQAAGSGELQSAIVRFRRDLNPEWEITLGEVAHNARAALDRMVAYLVAAEGGSMEQHRGQFPIYTDRTKYGKESRRALAGVPEPARVLIEAMQPFDYGVKDHPLALLAHVSNWDKHRDGHPSVALIRNTAVILKSEESRSIEILGNDLAQSHPATGRALQEGDNLFELFHPEEIQSIRARISDLRSRDSQMQVLCVWRTGVTFGRQRIFTFQVRLAIDHIEDHVLRQLEPFISPMPR